MNHMKDWDSFIASQSFVIIEDTELSLKNDN